MTKEILLSQSEIQKKLWGKVCGEQWLKSRIDKARKGHLPGGLTLDGNIERFNDILGDFAPRVLILSNPDNPLSLLPEQIAAAGGYCALRTKDVESLSKEGVIMNPITSELAEIKSVEQVCRWIIDSVTFDQAIESIGTPEAFEYVAISERRLWTERVNAKLSKVFDRKLSQAEQNMVERSLEEAEKIRAIITERYISLVTGNENVNFKRVIDDDIWEDLKKAQEEMFARAGITINDLVSNFPSDAETIKSSAIVWAMYSEPYFDMLRNKGFIKNKTLFIVEPTLHTFADTAAGNAVVNAIYQNSGEYFDPNGINKNTGFIAFIECVKTGGDSVRKKSGVGEVPNISNWKRLLKDGFLNPLNNNIIDPTQNQLFVWGVNLFPYGKVRDSLLALLEIQEEFQAEKKKISQRITLECGKKDLDARSRLQCQVDGLRKELLNKILCENEKIALNLEKLFVYLTKGVDAL